MKILYFKNKWWYFRCIWVTFYLYFLFIQNLHHLSVFVCFFDNCQLGMGRRGYEHLVWSFFGTVQHEDPFIQKTCSRYVRVKHDLCDLNVIVG